jgi:hypothetical protein
MIVRRPHVHTVRAKIIQTVILALVAKDTLEQIVEWVCITQVNNIR